MCNFCWLAVCIVVVVLCVCYLMCICCTVCVLLLFFTLDAGLLDRSQNNNNNNNNNNNYYYYYYYYYYLFIYCNWVVTRWQWLFYISEGPATGHLDTGFSWFPYVYKQMLRWFPRFQVATTCFSCSPPDLNSAVANFMFRIHVK